jgi:TRAP-type C4-dicarboxylate transport system substrate-binding protein
MSRFIVALLGSALLAGVATACGSAAVEAIDPEGPVNPAGPTGVPVVLQIGTNDFPGRPAADQIQDLADRVAELSDDTIRLEPTWRVGWDEPDWDQYVAREVMSGALDLAIVPSRALPDLGVTRLRVLDAPFLIDSDPLLDAVVTSDVAQDVLGDLEDVGMVGLALIPEGLRHPFGFEEPLLGPEDYDGATIRAPQAQATDALFAALGATTSQADNNPAVHAAVEASFQLDFVSGMAATGNVTFYPKLGALVMNADAFDELTASQQELLRQAVVETLQWSIDTRQSDVEAAASFCEQGGTVALASEEALAGLREATQPVYADLEADPVVAADIATIRAMAAELDEAPLPEPCGQPVAGEQLGDDLAFTDDPSVINGVYRNEVIEEELRAAGVPEDQIEPNVGVWSNTFQDGEWWDQEVVMGTYELDGDLMRITYAGGGDPEIFRWELTDRGDLVLEIHELADDEWRAFLEVWVSEPWLRVADVD